MEMKLKKVICAVAAFTMLSINYLPSVSFAKEQNYVCPMINAGHSGSASGTGLFLGAVGATEGTCDRAPFISGVTGNNSAEVASSRVVLCQDNGHIKPLFFSKISKMHKLVAFIPRFA